MNLTVVAPSFMRVASDAATQLGVQDAGVVSAGVDAMMAPVFLVRHERRRTRLLRGVLIRRRGLGRGFGLGMVRLQRRQQCNGRVMVSGLGFATCSCIASS